MKKKPFSRSKHEARIHTDKSLHSKMWARALDAHIHYLWETEPVLWRYTLNFINGIRKKNNQPPLSEADEVDLNAAILEIYSYYRWRQGVLEGPDRQMLQKDLEQTIEMSRELLRKLVGNSKLTDLLDASWDEVETLEAYHADNASPIRTSRAGRQLGGRSEVRFPLPGDSRFIPEPIKSGYTVPRNSRVSLSSNFPSLIERASDYETGDQFGLSTVYHLLHLYRLASHTAALFEATPKDQGIYKSRAENIADRPKESFHSLEGLFTDFEDFRGEILPAKIDMVKDGHWVVLRLAEIIEIFGGKCPATYWDVGPFAAIWKPWFEYSVGYKFRAYRYELCCEVGELLFSRAQEHHFENRVAGSDVYKDGTKRKTMPEITNGVVERIRKSAVDDPSGRELLGMLNIDGRHRVELHEPPKVAGEEFHPVTFSPITGSVLEERFTLSDDAQDYKNGEITAEQLDIRRADYHKRWLETARRPWGRDTLKRAESAYGISKSGLDRDSVLFGRPAASPIFEFCKIGQLAYSIPARVLRIKGVDHPLWMIATAFDFSGDTLFYFDSRYAGDVDEATDPFHALDGSRELSDEEVEAAAICWLEYLRDLIIGQFSEETWKKHAAALPTAQDVYHYWLNSVDYKAAASDRMYTRKMSFFI